MHVGIANPRWWGKRSRHSRRMRNPQFYVSGKSPWYHGFNDLVRQGARTAKPWYWPGSVRILHYQHQNSCNSSPPSAAYMGQLIGSVLVQIMACRLFGAKPLPAPMLVYCLLDPQEKIQWNLNQNTKLFIRENAFEKNVVCEMAGHFVQREVSLTLN